MKTDELIDQLSHAPMERRRASPTAIVAAAALSALALAVLLSVALLRPRSDDVDTVTFVLKLAFGVGVVCSVLPIMRDLCIPGRRLGMRSLLAAAPFAVIAIFAATELAARPAHAWSHHDTLASWIECLWLIPALAVPAFVILIAAARQLAPTNLKQTGAYAGLAAGGIGAIGYAFHCDHNSTALIATFYTLAIFETTALGAWLGPRFLRWVAPMPG